MKTKPSCGSGRALVSALAAAVSIGAVHAQSPSEQTSKASQLLSEVVVTATRSPRIEDTIPASITVLRAADIEKTSAQTVSDVLRFQSGVQVSDLLGTKRSPSVDLRGFGETAVNNTLVLVNGRRLNSADIGEVDWTTIPLERVERLEIVAIFRDWRRAEADRDPDYPQSSVQVIPIRVWPMSETREYVESRIAIHQAATNGLPVLCTDDERWFTGDKWAIIKPGGKRALRVLDAKPEQAPDGYVLEHRPGIYRRCERYCDVAPFCPQWASTTTSQDYATEE